MRYVIIVYSDEYAVPTIKSSEVLTETQMWEFVGNNIDSKVLFSVNELGDCLLDRSIKREE